MSGELPGRVVHAFELPAGLHPEKGGDYPFDRRRSPIAVAIREFYFASGLQPLTTLWFSNVGLPYPTALMAIGMPFGNS
jgi:hypothetical protein